MQQRIPKELLREIGARTDIVEVVGRYVSLRKKGRSHMGLCPFHSEKSPSFTVDAAKGLFYCFGCHAGGDVIKFLTQIENRSFMEVVEELAERAGIELPKAELSPRERAAMDEREHLFLVLEVAASYFERLRLTADAEAANAYLTKRGVPDGTASEFRLGYAPDGWHGLIDQMRKLNHPLFLAEKAGLVLKREGDRDAYYDRFRHRVMFPIRNVSGKVIGFGGRVLDASEPKYLNSPESPLFNKSETLFALDLARRAIGQKDRVVVVEGNFDTVSLHAAGIKNVVATCGTSLTRQHLQALKRYTRQVVLLYDGDKAGIKASHRALSLFLEEEMWPYFVPLPPGKDPDDVVREEGGERFQERIDKALPLLDAVLIYQAKLAHTSALERDAALNSISPLLPLLERLKPAHLDYYLNLIADHFAIDHSVVNEIFRRELKNTRRPTQEQAAILRPVVSAPLLPLPPHEEFLLQWLLQFPSEITPDVQEAGIVEWLTHDGLKHTVALLLAQPGGDGNEDLGWLLDSLEDPLLRTRVAELAIKKLEIPDNAREQTKLQCILGIKEKNLGILLKRVQAEIARLEREGGDAHRLNQLMDQKVALIREKNDLRVRSLDRRA